MLFPSMQPSQEADRRRLRRVAGGVADPLAWPRQAEAHSPTPARLPQVTVSDIQRQAAGIGAPAAALETVDPGLLVIGAAIVGHRRKPADQPPARPLARRNMPV